jgi:hypothetical protein
MVGDDAATAAFRTWWEAGGALVGGSLVYNTGRSLASFLELLKGKAGVMAVPDALILAVGARGGQGSFCDGRRGLGLAGAGPRAESSRATWPCRPLASRRRLSAARAARQARACTSGGPRAGRPTAPRAGRRTPSGRRR